MRAGPRLRLLLALAMGASSVEAQSYLDLVGSYRSGRYGPAARALLELSEEDVEGAARAARERPELARLAPAAAMLHAEAAFRDPASAVLHLGQARSYVERVVPPSDTRAFERDWNLLVGYFYLGQLRDERAIPYLQRAERADLEAVAPKLAQGVARALGGWLGADERKLSEARSILEELAGLPRTSEAPLHLAHVLLLQGDTGRAERLLAATRVEGEPLAEAVSLCLLARLRAERGELDRAIVDYRAALSVAPGLQNAAIGLSFALHRSGRAGEARRVLEGFLQREDGASSLDPWWRFVLGEAARFEEHLRRMRAEVTR